MMGSPMPPDGLKGVTQEEISKLTKAMKDGQFRSHMDEYCKEVSDPANRKEYIQYLEQLEAQGEMPEGQCLLRAEPGCCVKTSIRFKNGQTQKLFINIVHSDRLDDFELRAADGGGRHVHLPYSLSPPRPDRDLKDQYCMTCDCAVSSRTFFQAGQNPQIMKMIVDTACDGLSTNFLKGYEEVRKDFKLMERLKCKGGFPMPMSVRAELMKDKGGKKHTPKHQIDAVTPSELRQMRQEAKDKKNSQKEEEERAAEEAAAKAEAAARAKVEETAPRIRVPKHRLIHSGSIDLSDFMENKNQQLPTTTTVPKVLRLVVELPTVKKSSDVSLEVTNNNVVIEVPGKYYLDLPLSYEVEETNGTAKFDKSKQELTLELPVVPKPPIFAPPVRHVEAVDGGDNDGGLSEGGGSEDDEAAAEPAAADSGSSAAGQDWIDRLGGSGAPPATASGATAASEAAAEPKRQTLEFDAGSSLHIATAASDGEASPAAAGPAVQELPDEAGDDDDEKDLPMFQASDFFQGAKRGYYFGRGPEGMGYYRDQKRQPAPKPVPSPPADAGPLVQDVTPAPRVQETPREPLPVALQAYVDATSALSRRIPASEVDPSGQADWQIECRQNRQNVMIFVELPHRSEVADLQLSVAGHRLTLGFCTRPRSSDDEATASASSGTSARWQRWRLRRTLGGAADARQWHAEIVDRGEAAAPQLGVVLRKVRRGDVWPEVLDVAMPAAEEPTEPTAAAAADGGGEGEADEAAGGEAEPDISDDVGADATADVPQDSAELDVAPEPGPSAAPGPGAAAALAAASASAASVGGAAPVTATAAMVQSATVMGQSVLLTSRLVYQLL